MRAVPALLLLATAGCGSGQATVVPPFAETRTTMRIEVQNRASEVEITRNPYVRESTIQMNADEALGQLAEIYRMLGMDGGAVLNEEDLIFGIHRVRAHRRVGALRMTLLLDCGSSLLGDADSYHITLSVLSAVNEIGDQMSVLRTWVEATGRQDAMSSTPVTCSSTGRLEREIEGRMAQQGDTPRT